MKPVFIYLTLGLLLLTGCDLLPSTNESPTVSFSQPGDNATLTQGESVTVAADASDGDGEVRRVDFTFNSRLLYTAERAPYTHTFAPEETGQFTLTAQAFDDRDASSDVASVNVSVAPAPANTFNVKVNVSGAGTVTSDPRRHRL